MLRASAHQDTLIEQSLEGEIAVLHLEMVKINAEQNL